MIPGSRLSGPWGLGRRGGGRRRLSGAVSAGTGRRLHPADVRRDRRIFDASRTRDFLAGRPGLKTHARSDGRGQAFVIATLGRTCRTATGRRLTHIRRALGEAAILDRFRVDGAGNLRGLGRPTTSHWMRCCSSPSRGGATVPAGRRWLFSHAGWLARPLDAVFEWDGFFNALLAPAKPSNLEDMAVPCSRRSAPSGLTERGAPRGDARPLRSAHWSPSCASRAAATSHHPRRALPVLDAWHAWWLAGFAARRRRWRVGNHAWGSDVRASCRVGPTLGNTSTRAPSEPRGESGQDDLPNGRARWDELVGPLAMGCVDLSAFAALDAECRDPARDAQRRQAGRRLPERAPAPVRADRRPPGQQDESAWPLRR